MEIFHARLFRRIIHKSREVYFLKIITLAIAFASAALIMLFSDHEFRYDRFHNDSKVIFRILERNNDESYDGNRLSTAIGQDVLENVKSKTTGSLMLSRVKLMTDVNVYHQDKTFRNCEFYAADSQIADIFSFDILSGSLERFRKEKGVAILSASTAKKFFGAIDAVGKHLKVFSFEDTVQLTIVAIYKDYPQNSHEEFDSFMKFEQTILERLRFDPFATSIYGKLTNCTFEEAQMLLNGVRPGHLRYSLQPIVEIYFGPRVMSENSKHGDEYSIIILICITFLIVLLALSCFINLTTLSLPNRAKELAVKKLAGKSENSLMLDFAGESFAMVGISLGLGIIILIFFSEWLFPILSVSIISLLSNTTILVLSIALIIPVITAISPLFLATKFVRASPTRLLSTDVITFPAIKRSITFLQLGISIFLIVASMVVRRQVTYSLLKEPGRNYDQIVYMNYPANLDDEGLRNLRATWQRNTANILDILGTSQLPNRINSRELDSDFYFLKVDPEFKEFFGLQMISGNWFRPNAGDSIIVVNERGSRTGGLLKANTIGVFADFSKQFNQGEKPVKISLASHNNYNFLCIKVLEVDIRKTIEFLSGYFTDGKKASISFLNKRFQEWLLYQDRLNTLSKILAVVSGILSCCAIYGLSISIVRDKLKPIAIHKLFGASSVKITRILVREFAWEMIKAIVIFGPLTYLVIKEFLRRFAYATPFEWTDPLIPLAYCVTTIILLCIFQTFSLNRKDLTVTLKKS